MRWFWMFSMIFGISCVNDLGEVDRLLDPEAGRTEWAKDVEIIYSDSVAVKVRITSPLLVRNLDQITPYDEFPDGVFVEFFDSNQNISSTLSAKYGIRYPRTKKIIVRDSVVLQNIQREQLETSELIWDENNKVVQTDKFVKITKPEEIIFAYGFRANQDFSEYELLSVAGRVKVEEEP
jgi:LPS export ABC transporter protein LptC